MLVYYNTQSGEPLYTLAVQEGFRPPAGDYIEVEDQVLEMGHWRVENGALVPLTDLMVGGARAAAISRVNQTIGDVRRQFITDLPAQDMIYLRKEEEARAWLAQPDQDLALYPLLSQEIGITAPDPDQLSQIWLNMSAMWIPMAAMLEGVRLGAISALEQANDETTIASIMDAFHAQLTAFN